ncbi:alpha-(1,6)-fucosyltransferase-like [Engraulis encrasicolus]|uniref:alpha-(1,6)-fucosyltransferase-like n=1 Tax=Engraulis encrasicolus TaxID=184585 RepID=UPI002FCF0C52
MLEEQLNRAKQKIHSFQQHSADTVGPGQEHEELRRRVESGVRELWYFVRSEVRKLDQTHGPLRRRLTDNLLHDLGTQQRSIMTDLFHFSHVDGAGDWRQKEANRDTTPHDEEDKRDTTPHKEKVETAKYPMYPSL